MLLWITEDWALKRGLLCSTVSLNKTANCSDLKTKNSLSAGNSLRKEA